ncbi:MAG: hypothetical protein FJX25_16685 [Alphaproteobacteria bacterium]|nr:hypothetical protein [Alphaproteobacteria bacterium]
MGPIVGLKEVLGMLLRRGPLIALILSAGICAAIYHAMSLPRSYEAITVLQIEPSVLSGGLTMGASDTPARLRLIEQRLMARSNVLNMIERYDLFEAAPDLPAEERIALFRESVRIDFIPAAGAAPGTEGEVSALLITVRTGRPADAANLANDMADQILSNNRAARAQRLDDLVQTLHGEDRRLLAQLTAVQSETNAFRTRHSGSLPENIELLSAEQTRLEVQRVELSRALQALERERLALEVSSGDGTRNSSLIQQLRMLEVDLAQARRTLNPDHPEVRRLEEAVESLREGQAQQLSPGISRQVDLIREQAADLLAERDAIDRRLPELEAAIAAIPEVASGLADFERRIGAFEVERSSIAERLARAELDQRLTASDYGDRMVVLERATQPQHPMSSARRKVAILGVGGSFALALLAAFALELARPVLRTPRQVHKALGVTPIAVARYYPSGRARLQTMMRNLATLSILTVGAALAVIMMMSTGQ